jgi:hypothetical protein
MQRHAVSTSCEVQLSADETAVTEQSDVSIRSLDLGGPDVGGRPFSPCQMEMPIRCAAFNTQLLQAVQSM